MKNGPNPSSFILHLSSKGRFPVRSPVEASPKRLMARAISRRRFLIFAGSTGSLALLAACQGGAPQAPQPTQEPLAARTMAPVVQPTAARPAHPAAPAAQPAAAPTAAPAVGKPEPKGKYTEAFNASIPPAWLDPQENPPQVTPYHFDYAIHDAMLKHMPGKEFAPSLAESYEI